MPCGLVYTSRNLRVRRGKRVYSSLFDDFHQEEMMNLIKDGCWDENGNEIACAVSDNTPNTQLKNVSSEEFRTMKPEVLEPSFLGIQPEPPSWPERDEILRLGFERKLKSVGIPVSIRMIRKKLQLKEEGFKEAGELAELTNCSVKKTFSSMMFILHELQNHALQTRESLCGEDLESVVAKLGREMDNSFVWLFQQVFWKTPSLMVYVMVLLANFLVFSMNDNSVKAITPPSMITKALLVTNKESKLQHPHVDADGNVVQGEHAKEELSEEEEMLWDSLLEEASMFQNELRSAVLGNETKQRLVAPVSVDLEGDQYEEYVKTELHYKKHLLQTPDCSLLLSNYAQFLFLVLHDIDGAEEYYKRSVLVESPEAEAFSRYADFLLMVRKDFWAAELRYLQALEADPGNTYYLSKYASFLWTTSGQDSNSFPLEELDNLQL